MAPARTTVTLARLAAAGLTVVDVACAWSLGTRSPRLDRVLGASTGAWRDWGVGALAGFALVQAPAALRPSQVNLAQLAAARAVVAAGHVSGLAIRAGRGRALIATLLVGNVAGAVVGWRASRELADARGGAPDQRAAANQARRTARYAVS